MIGICIGIGPGWEKLARHSAAIMEKNTGVPCQVLNHTHSYDVCHPSWLKTRIFEIYPDEDSFLVFDADLLCLEEWDPAGLFEQLGRPFMAVPEPNANPDLIAECREWRMGYPDVYLNMGLFICGHEHRHIMDLAWDLHPNGGRWMEQTAINYAISRDQPEVCRLPRRFNLLAQQGRINSIYCRGTLQDAVNVHTCAIPDAEQILAHHHRLQDYIESGLAGRDRIAWLLNLPERSVGAELGVFRGDFSKAILHIVDPQTLHLVDLFEGQIISGDQDGRSMRCVQMDTVPAHLEALGPAVKVWKADSVEWLNAQPEHSLDWVYIDTSHDYEPTLAELRAAARAVKPGGIIGGHDFARAFPGVVRAVIEFKKETGWDLEIYDGDLLPSFSIRRA